MWRVCHRRGRPRPRYHVQALASIPASNVVFCCLRIYLADPAGISRDEEWGTWVIQCVPELSPEQAAYMAASAGLLLTSILLHGWVCCQSSPLCILPCPPEPPPSGNLAAAISAGPPAAFHSPRRTLCGPTTGKQAIVARVRSLHRNSWLLQMGGQSTFAKPGCCCQPQLWQTLFWAWRFVFFSLEHPLA